MMLQALLRVSPQILSSSKIIKPLANKHSYCFIDLFKFFPALDNLIWIRHEIPSLRGFRTVMLFRHHSTSRRKKPYQSCNIQKKSKNPIVWAPLQKKSFICSGIVTMHLLGVAFSCLFPRRRGFFRNTKQLRYLAIANFAFLLPLHNSYRGDPLGQYKQHLNHCSSVGAALMMFLECIYPCLIFNLFPCAKLKKFAKKASWGSHLTSNKKTYHISSSNFWPARTSSKSLQFKGAVLPSPGHLLFSDVATKGCPHFP